MKSVKDVFAAEESGRILELIESASRLSGLHVCFHDRMNHLRLPESRRTHSHPSCQRIKKTSDSICVQFDCVETHRDLAGLPRGRIHVCPFRFTEIAVPVYVNSIFRGVIFAGPCWNGRGTLPSPELVKAANSQWIEDRLLMMQAFAERLSAILEGRYSEVSGGRRASILAYLNKKSEEHVPLSALASHLCLSVSRTGHLVKEVFGIPFPELVRSYKMRRAAQMLVSDDLPVGEIAASLGYDDQNYFTRVFTRHFKESPRSFRKKGKLTA
ncbi:MAG TPA: hypothetical protein DET40_06705 [Lentisphaeria bacterium]|nr:MAG: hypothetical protein A2X45_01085 [Lentisphaerae bacterium GWF2_50_93]HCE43219.1 hypothetical protein [Lentisphaeria bacterium]